MNEVVLSIIATGVVLLLFFYAIRAWVFSKKRRQKMLARALNMKLYRVLLPERATTNDDESKSSHESQEDAYRTMEQLYAAFSGLKAKGLMKNYFGGPAIAFEVGYPEAGKAASVYAAVPRVFASSFEKLPHSLFPDARVEPSQDYNVMNKDGATVVAEVRLKRDGVWPIKTYSELGQDTFTVLAGTFAKFKELGEGAAFQIVVRPAQKSKNKFGKKLAKGLREGKSIEEVKRKQFDKSVLGMFVGLFSSKKKKVDEPKTGDEETAKRVEEKAIRAGYDANIRLVTSAPDEATAERMMGEIASLFEQFSDPHCNALKVSILKNKRASHTLFDFAFRIPDAKSACYLATHELVTLFHFPRGTKENPHMETLRSHDAPIPREIASSGLLLGENVYHNEATPVYVADDDRMRHLYIIGQTGTGKTAFFKNMIMQDIQNGKGVCFIDPHGDTAEDLLGLIPDERMKDLIYFDPSDVDRPMGLNFLEYDIMKPEQKTFVVNELFSIFQKLYGKVPESMGPMFEQYFRNSTLLVLEDPPTGNTILEIGRVLSDKAFRDLKLSRSNNMVVNTFWRQVAEKAGGESSLANIVPYIRSKFDTFLANDIMRPIIAQETSSFDFRAAMDSNKILLVNLSKGRIGELNSSLLGLIIVGKILIGALSRADLPESERKDFYLYIDEFQNTTTPAIATILSEARKYRLGLVIAHQFIGQLEDEIRKAVFGNVGSIVSFRVGTDDTETMVNVFSPVFSEDDLLKIDNFNAYARLLSHGQSMRPFNFHTMPPAKSDPARIAQAKEFSRLQYGRRREEVEAEIRSRYEKFGTPVTRPSEL